MIIQTDLLLFHDHVVHRPRATSRVVFSLLLPVLPDKQTDASVK